MGKYTRLFHREVANSGGSILNDKINNIQESRETGIGKPPVGNPEDTVKGDRYRRLLQGRSKSAEGENGETNLRTKNLTNLIPATNLIPEPGSGEDLTTSTIYSTPESPPKRRGTWDGIPLPPELTAEETRRFHELAKTMAATEARNRVLAERDTGDVIPGQGDERRAYREQRKRERRETIAANDPALFHDMPEEDRRQLRAWVRDKLAPRQVTRPRSSYALKHTAEKALGFYVSNAELKGAMLEAGYEPVWDNRVNMGFRCGPPPVRRMLFWDGGWQRDRELPMEAFEFDRVFGADLTCD